MIQTLGNSSYDTGTRWKGRQQNTSPRYQEFIANWVHRDYVRANPSLGNVPASIDQTPSQVAAVYDNVNDAPAAPAFLGNTAMRSLGELGPFSIPRRRPMISARQPQANCR